MLIWLPSSLRLNRCEPHSEQKHFSKPPSGMPPALDELLALQEPERRPVDPRLRRAPDPVRFWQRVQWQ